MSPEPDRHLNHRHPVVEDLQNCPIALLHNPELHQHDATPRSRPRPGSTARQPATRNTTTGTTVAQQPEPLSPRHRDRTGRCPTTTGAATSSIYRDHKRRRAMSSPGTRLTLWPRYLADRSNPSGGVDAVGSAAGVGEGAVFAGAVVLDPVAADQLLADGDLDGVTDDGDLDLAAPIARSRPGSSRRRSTRCRTSRPCGSPTATTPTAVDGPRLAAALRRRRSACRSDAGGRGSRRAHRGGGSAPARPRRPPRRSGRPATRRPCRSTVANPIVPLALTPAASSPARDVDGSPRRAAWPASHGRLGELEPFDRRHPPDRLVRPLVVVVPHPAIELRLGVVDRGEHLAVEELAAQRLVPPLDLARRGRRPRRGRGCA